MRHRLKKREANADLEDDQERYDQVVASIGKLLVQPSANDGLISAQAESGFAVMVHRKGFAMVWLK